MPTCYENIFAFRPDQTCAAPVVPTSGLYIDDLEGISLLTSEATGKHTYENAQAILNAKTSVALQKIEAWLQQAMMRRGFYLPQQQPAGNVCSYKSSTQPVAGIGRGLTLYRSPNATFLAHLYLNKVTYKAATSGTATLEITDLNGVILFVSAPTPVTANTPLEFVVNAYYSVNVRVVVITDTQPYDTNCEGSCACLCSAARPKHPAQAMYFVKGYDGTGDATTSYGVTVCAALRCSIQALICYVMDYIKTPLLYMTGAEIMREMRALNAPTAQSIGYYAKDVQKETIDRWDKEAMQILATQVDTIIYQLRDLDHYCISCNTPSKIKINSLR